MRQPVPFGKYLLLERISVGGMAEVFKAKAFGVEGFEKVLAIKRILPSMAEDADFIEMFIDEAKIAGQLNHANVAQIFELGVVDDSHFIAMEYVWGKDLLQIQNRFRRMKQTMPFAMAAYCVAKMCEGLDYAHKKKDAAGKSLAIIHRDVSPQNVLVSYDGEVKVIDFGIAKAASRSTKTQAGVLKGKFGYMSPEQVRGLPLDRRSDVFAISTILYELLTAERLFLGESDFATLEKVRNVDVQRPSTAVPGCPPAIEKIIVKGLSRDAEDRYQWASEMQEDLQQYLATLDPPFGMKLLGAWMKEQFAPEIKRETQVIEDQKRLAREGVAAAPPAPPAGSRATIAPGGIPPIALSSGGAARMPGGVVPNSTLNLSVDDLLNGEIDDEIADVEMEEVDEGLEAAPSEIKGEATLISTELPPEVLALVTAAGAAQAAKAAQAARSPAPSEMPSQATMILEAPQISAGASPSHSASDMPSQSTMILDTAAAGGVGLPPLPGQSTVMLEAPQYPPPRAVTPSPRQIDANPETSAVNSPQFRPVAPRHSTVTRDLLTGIFVAVVVVGGVLGMRAYATRNFVVHGTVVVTVSPPGDATVVVDGIDRGPLVSGTAMTLRDIAAGPHKVQVRSEGAMYEQGVTVIANDVVVVTALLKRPESPSSTGHFKLDFSGDGGSGSTVWIDGAQLEDGAFRDPIPLRTGKPHEFRITRPGFEEMNFTVTLKTGEDQSRQVTLAPATGHLELATDPPGAEVAINGKLVGTTPYKVDDLDVAKETRVTIRKSGFSAITKYVSFKTDNHQSFNLKLSSGSSATVGEEASPPVGDKPSGKKSSDDGEDMFALTERREKPARADKPGRGGEAKPESEEKGHAPAGDEGKAPSASDPGFLVANTQPWAKVLIDNRDTGKTTPIAPRSKIALKPGKHVVTFVANGKKYNFDIVIKPGEDFRLIRELADAP